MSKYKKLKSKYEKALAKIENLTLELYITELDRNSIEWYLKSAESALVYKEEGIEHKNRLLKSLIES